MDDHTANNITDNTASDTAADRASAGGLNDVDGRVAVEALAVLPPGPELALALSRVQLSALSAHDLVTVAQAWERLQAHAAACLFEVMTQLVRDDAYQLCDHPQDIDIGHVHRAVDPCADELSLALAWSPGRAKHRLMTAVELVDELPNTLTALKAGVIDADKAGLIVERTRNLNNDESRRQVEAAVLPAAGSKTRRQLDNMLRRAVIAADLATAEQRRATASTGRRVSPPEAACDGGVDGMAFMTLYGPVEDLTAFYTAVDAAARHARDTNNDERTLEQLRFDTLTGLGWTALNLGHLGCCAPDCNSGSANTGVANSDAGHAGPPAAAGAPGEPAAAAGPHRLGRRHGRAATVHVTVAASTLFGADEQPGWLDEFGPITAAAARRIATEGPWRRLLTDPVDGQLLEYGRTTYTPPAHLAGFVAARDRTCRFPTCDHPARDTDIDHQTPYAHGGTTSAYNLWALDRRHHIGKTIHRYRIHTDPDGATWWVTPAGHHYRVEPESIGPITRRPVSSTPTPTPTPSNGQPARRVDPPPF